MEIDTYNLKYRMSKKIFEDKYNLLSLGSSPEEAFKEGQYAILVLLEDLTGTQFTRLLP